MKKREKKTCKLLHIFASVREDQNGIIMPGSVNFEIWAKIFLAVFLTK